MPLWISLYLPTYSLDVLFPQWLTKTPLAVVLQKERVLACTPAAQALGVRAGMRRSSVLGLAPQALVRDCNPAAEQHGLQQVALTLLQYTPNLALLNPHSILIEVSASLRLFKGPNALWRKLQSTLTALGLNVRAGMAPTAQGAWLLAFQTQSKQRRTIKKTSLSRRLDPLPFGVLPATQAYADWLDGIGCQTLEQLRRLPRKGLQHRSDPALVHAIDAAYGDIDEHLTWFEAPEFFSQRYDLTERLEHTHAVLAIARRLIEQLCGWLQTKHYAVNTLAFQLHHEKGRHARPPTEVILTLSQASWRPDDFLTVLSEQLHQLTLSAPVIAIELSISAVEPRPGLSSSLFPEPTQWMNEELRLLDLLRARLGAGHVRQAQPQADYRPEYANRWVPSADSPASLAKGSLSRASENSPHNRPAAAGNPPCLGMHTRPFWLLPTPLALTTQTDRPVYKGSALRLIQGPERIESGWWNEPGHELRDYFIAEDSCSARYWVYRQRESLDARWFLHGLFG